MLHHPGDQASARQQDDGHERGDLERGGAQGDRHALHSQRLSAEDCREHDECGHREQVFHDHPAHGNVAGAGVQVAVVGEDANQHDRTGH